MIVPYSELNLFTPNTYSGLNHSKDNHAFYFLQDTNRYTSKALDRVILNMKSELHKVPICGF